MSKMSELMIEIVDLLDRDFTASEVSDILNIDVDIVYDVMDALEEEREAEAEDSEYCLDLGYTLQ